MTVVVSYLCSDGVVIAADSMLTSRIGVGSNILPIGHHSGLKVYVLPGPQLFAFPGDPGQAARFKLIAEINHGISSQQPTPLGYPIQLSSVAVRCV